MRIVNRSATTALLVFIGTILTVDRTWAQIDLTGEWAVRLHEDQLHRNDVLPGGLAVGDYTGLPINDAARRKADSWDASILSSRERQTIPGPSVYGGRAASVRISKIVDDDTQKVVAFKIYRAPGNNGTFRTIWMDGRPHPPEYAAHTWQGFSTGTWQGEMLTVETTHVKMSWIQRNGVASSDRAVMTEHFVRHGTVLTIISVVYDPVYLEEPFVRSTNYVLDLGQQLEPIHGEIVDEIAGRPDGYVPHHLPGTNDQLKEFAERLGLPFEASRGGRDSTYPEYQLTLQKMAEQLARTSKRATE
jgi:hypothetical protein